MSISPFDYRPSCESQVRLTGRENEVLALIIQGITSGAVAKQLGISRRTVEFHLAEIYAKLEVHNRMAAYNRALQLGLVDPR